ncbi:alpha/beta hydrolase [Oleiharenicola lentus]|uniref:Alpha/beta hydrolase n=2 Tax=Oleiharenicola lentus TaxID=2508720 RepID=A0A4Q1CBZ9_9BACT|nr:alpha/beta hydrolase [Oleiharenicola lentus]
MSKRVWSLDRQAGVGFVAGMSDILLQVAGKRGVPVPPPPHTPAVMGELAASIFLHPMRVTRRMPRELAYLEGARRRTMPTSAGDLAAWEWGEAGRPLVGLLHGWEGHGAQLGAFAAPLLAAGFRVLTFDAPGHGDSPGDECSAPLLGRLLVEIQAQAGGIFALVAHSMGCAAAAMAVVNGVSVRGLVFLAPPVSQLDRVERMCRRMEIKAETAGYFRAAVERRTGMLYTEANMFPVAQQAPCPLLALHDPADDSTDYAATEQFVAQWRGARLVPCPGRGHYRLLSTPEVVRQAVEFIAGLR